MKTLSIDIETRSGYDLSKCGAYKYVESPDYDILLFGYSADGGEVQVVDLAQGEKIPEEVLRAIVDIVRSGIVRTEYIKQNGPRESEARSGDEKPELAAGRMLWEHRTAFEELAK